MAGMSGHWAFTFGLLGNIVSFMVYLAPLPTFYQIYKKKSTEGFQSVPYVVALFSAMLWIYYAFLKSNTTLLITINSVGCFIEAIYICFYLFYAPKKAKIQAFRLVILLNVVGFGTILILTHFLANGPTRACIVGWICLVFSLCVFVAPLCIVRQVIRTKSVEFMPFPLSFFLTLSAVMWFFYGLLIKDYNIAIPNVLGFTLGILQMVLYIIYTKSKVVLKEEKDEKVAKIQSENVVVLEEPKLQEMTERIIDVVKLTALLEQIPVVAAAARANDAGIEVVEHPVVAKPIEVN